MAVQGGGAGVAAIAQAEGEDTRFGGNLVVVGLAIQLGGYLMLDVILFEFVRCVRGGREVAVVGWEDKEVWLQLRLFRAG